MTALQLRDAALREVQAPVAPTAKQIRDAMLRGENIEVPATTARKTRTAKTSQRSPVRHRPTSSGECYECGAHGTVGHHCHECHEGMFV